MSAPSPERDARTYTPAPHGLDAVETPLAAHRQFPREQYAAGAVLARGAREHAAAIAAGDPFTREGVAEYRSTEFVPTTTAPELTSVREAAG